MSELVCRTILLLNARKRSLLVRWSSQDTGSRPPSAYHHGRLLAGNTKKRGLDEILHPTTSPPHALSRFPRVQDSLSYARLVKGTHESAGKTKKLRPYRMEGA